MELAYFIIDRNANFPDIHDCLNHTCANGGLCVDGVYSYSCNFSPDYIGDRSLIGWYKLPRAVLFREIFFQAMKLVYLLIEGKC